MAERKQLEGRLAQGTIVMIKKAPLNMYELMKVYRDSPTKIELIKKLRSEDIVASYKNILSAVFRKDCLNEEIPGAKYSGEVEGDWVKVYRIKDRGYKSRLKVLNKGDGIR